MEASDEQAYPPSRGTSLRFRFQLTPLAEVTPWTTRRGGRCLHWFALTDGWYWIELGTHELLRYSPETVRRFQQHESRPRHPYVDYYVARFWEDLIQLAPTVMQPVPHDLADFIATDRHDLFEPESEESWAAAIWHGHHVLNLGYLRPAQHIRMWRTVADDLDEVTVTWRHGPHTDLLFADPAGQVAIPAASFLAAVRQLDSEFMTAMRERVSEVERTVPPPDVEIDMEQLHREHLDRTTWLAQRSAPEPDTDWSAVRAGAACGARRVGSVTLPGRIR
jgi:hypothetical protein